MKHPPVTSAGLPQIATELADEFHGIELCALHGVLGEIRRLKDFSSWIPRRFWKTLAWLETTNQAFACPKRAEWIAVCLRRFRARLQAPRLRFAARAGREPNEIECLGPDGHFWLRFDQVAYQREWGIEIFAEEPGLDRQLAAYCLTESLERLRSDWESVNDLCFRARNKGDYIHHLRFTDGCFGRHFEQLILGILNERSLLAAAGTLYEDACEWTDLRYRGAGGLHCVRLQVKSHERVAEHDALVADRVKQGGVVIISPVQIARFAQAEIQAGGEFPVERFLSLFPRTKIDNLQALSTAIFKLFAVVLRQPRHHPFDPVARIPRVLRQTLRAMVDRRADEIERHQPEALASSCSTNKYSLAAAA